MSLRDEEEHHLVPRDVELAEPIEAAVRAAVELPPHQNPVDVYIARLGSARSRQTMHDALERLAELLTAGRCPARRCPWWTLRYQETAALRARLSEIYAPASVNKHLAALRGVLREAWRLGLMDAEAFHRAVDISSVKGHVLPAGRDLSPGEINALVQICRNDEGPAGSRDATLFALLAVGGLRRAEAVALDLIDYGPEDGSVVVRRGKGRNDRRVYIAGGSQRAMNEWLTQRGDQPGAILTPVNKGGRVTIRRLSPQTIVDICHKRAKQAGVAPFSPHDLRRTMVGSLLNAGADLATVQRLAGHASPTTTSRYDRRGEAVKRDAISRLHFPWRSRIPEAD